MTKLEKDIFKAIAGCCISDESATQASKDAAEAVKRWVDRAFEAGSARATFSGRPGVPDALTKGEWLKENGVI